MESYTRSWAAGEGHARCIVEVTRSRCEWFKWRQLNIVELATKYNRKSKITSEISDQKAYLSKGKGTELFSYFFTIKSN